MVSEYKQDVSIYEKQVWQNLIYFSLLKVWLFLPIKKSLRSNGIAYCSDLNFMLVIFALITKGSTDGHSASSTSNAQSKPVLC